jgi:predicted ribosomally synthesized peptide with SipW-like signal peptide
MEKKNTILLTVIAIATLLVAVVGATFAYFTATVTTTNAEDGGSATTSVKATVLPTATMEYGKTLNATDVFPGYKGVKKINISASCSASSCSDIGTKIIVTPTIDKSFGEDVTWTLYKSSNEIVCSTTETNGYTDTNGTYASTYSCTNTDTATKVMSNSSTSSDTNVTVSNGVYEYAVTVSYKSSTDYTNDNYYLVVEYANTNSVQDAQGKSFSFALDFKAA